MGKIRWLREAQNDLKKIFDYISPDSRRYARLQIERIQKRTEILKNQPKIGKIVEEMEDPQIRELIEGNYRIIYREVDENQIDILMIHHGARDLTRRIQ